MKKRASVRLVYTHCHCLVDINARVCDEALNNSGVAILSSDKERCRTTLEMKKEPGMQQDYNGYSNLRSSRRDDTPNAPN